MRKWQVRGELGEEENGGGVRIRRFIGLLLELNLPPWLVTVGTA